MSSSNLIQSQLIALCRIYQSLESQCLFPSSPQKIHLSYTLSRLFELLDTEERICIFKQFLPIHDEKNINLWIALSVSNFPMEFSCRLENEVVVKCKSVFDKFFASKIQNETELHYLIQLIKLLAAFPISSDVMDEYIMKAWMNCCISDKKIISKEKLDSYTNLFVEYVGALLELTKSVAKMIFLQPVNLVKVLHVISNLILQENMELQLLLIEPLCEFATCHMPENRSILQITVSETIKNLFHEGNIVKGKLLNKLRKYMKDFKMEKIISLTYCPGYNEDMIFKENWLYFLDHGTLKNHNKMPLKEQLYITMEFQYIHKCLETKKESVHSGDHIMVPSRNSSANFDFADIDNLFETVSDSEPESKRIKYSKDISMETNDTEEIITRLESETSLLCRIKENVFDVTAKKRIRKVCEKLRNIFEID